MMCMRNFLPSDAAYRTAAASLLLITFCASNLGAQTADQLVKQGREQLTKQTPGGLRKADELFTKALAKKQGHAAANVLKTATSFALVNRLPSTITTLELLGIGTHDTNVYDPEYSIPVDTKGRPAPAKSAATKQIKDWNRRVALPQIDEALGRLAKVGNKKFLLILSKRETGDRSLRIDYGDVQGVRFGLLMAKAIIALQDTYNSDASFYAAYQMIRRGQLDLETFLKRYPLLLTKAGPDQRALSKRYFLAAESAYQLASPVFRARDPKKRDFHFLTVGNLDSEKIFRRSLVALRKSFKSPQTVGALKVDAAISARARARQCLCSIRPYARRRPERPEAKIAKSSPKAGQGGHQVAECKLPRSHHHQRRLRGRQSRARLPLPDPGQSQGTQFRYRTSSGRSLHFQIRSRQRHPSEGGNLQREGIRTDKRRNRNPGHFHKD